ncbi:MAG: F0F1 ATP synthase subunit gamma [Spirochaetales bacterium]|nr:F0F1 ATP synthase subunit gamma [Spirochaetales bacterium]
MEQIQGIKKKIKSTNEMHGIVKTMKTLSAVNIRQYERALESLRHYSKTIFRGFHIVLRALSEQAGSPGNSPPSFFPAAGNGRRKALHIIIVIGSEQGLVGRFNQRLLDFLKEKGNLVALSEGRLRSVSIGYKIGGLLRNEGIAVNEEFPMAGSLDDITPLLADILQIIRVWLERDNVGRITIYYNRLHQHPFYFPSSLTIYPPSPEELNGLGGKPWEGGSLPVLFDQPEKILKAMIREYIYIELFRTLVESLSSENSSRLATMDNTEKTIGRRQKELTAAYNRLRQTAITGELLDIVSGFESITG